MAQFLETRWERKARLIPYLLTHTTCPTTDGTDLELWDELKEKENNDRFSSQAQPSVPCDEKGMGTKEGPAV